MAEFNYVWLSTDKQMKILSEAYRNASIGTKLLGRYKLPGDAAHLRGLLTPWMRIALVFVAEGALTVTEDALTFAARPRGRFGWLTRGTWTDLSFSCSASQLIGVEAEDIPSPIASYFDIPFTRVRSTLGAPLDNFLLCAGGRISMPSIRAQSLALCESLQQLTGNPEEIRSAGSD